MSRDCGESSSHKEGRRRRRRSTRASCQQAPFPLVSQAGFLPGEGGGRGPMDSQSVGRSVGLSPQTRLMRASGKEGTYVLISQSAAQSIISLLPSSPPLQVFHHIIGRTHIFCIGCKKSRKPQRTFFKRKVKKSTGSAIPATQLFRSSFFFWPPHLSLPFPAR